MDDSGSGMTSLSATPGPVRYKHNHRPGFSCPACYIKTHGALPSGFFEAQEKKERETSDKVGAVMSTIRAHRYAGMFLDRNFGRPRHLTTPEFVDLASVATGVLEGKYKARPEFFLRDTRTALRSALATFHPSSADARAVRDLIRLVEPQLEPPTLQYLPHLVTDFPPGARVDVRWMAQWKPAVVLTYLATRVYLHFEETPMEDDAWVDLTPSAIVPPGTHTNGDAPVPIPATTAVRRAGAPPTPKNSSAHNLVQRAASFPRGTDQQQPQTSHPNPHNHMASTISPPSRGRAWYAAKQLHPRQYACPFTADTSGLFPPDKKPAPLPPSIFEAAPNTNNAQSFSNTAPSTHYAASWAAKNKSLSSASFHQSQTSSTDAPAAAASSAAAAAAAKKRSKPVPPFDRNMAKNTVGDYPEPPRKVLRRGVSRPVTVGSRVQVDMLDGSEPVPVIERVVARRRNMRRRGALEYCVQWRHIPIQNATWETRKALMNLGPALVLQFDARHPCDPNECFPEPETEEEAEEYEEIERKETRVQELESLKMNDLLKEIPVPPYFEQPLMEVKMGGGMTLQFRRAEFSLFQDAMSVTRDAKARRGRYRQEFPDFYRLMFPPNSKELAVEKRRVEEEQRQCILQATEHLSLIKIPRHIGSVMKERVIIGADLSKPGTAWTRHMERVGLQRVDIRTPPTGEVEDHPTGSSERSEAAKLLLDRETAPSSKLRYDSVWCCYR